MAITTRSLQRDRIARVPIRYLGEQSMAREKILIGDIVLLGAPGRQVERLSQLGKATRFTA
jgi:hypothetical protein